MRILNNAFPRTKSTVLNPRNLDLNRLSVEMIFTKFSADLNEENNVIRLHLRRTERVLSEREARYFEVSVLLHTVMKSVDSSFIFLFRHVRMEIWKSCKKS